LTKNQRTTGEVTINVSINGRKLFDWEGSAAEAAKLDEEMRAVARKGGVTPASLANTVVALVLEQGGIELHGEMPLLVWTLLSHPDRWPDEARARAEKCVAEFNALKAQLYEEE
jgi:hypothetical protein